MSATNCVAGIDVHKSMLAVVVAPSGDETLWDRRKFGATVAELKHLAAWLRERGVQDVVMESTATYWRPVWLGLECHFRLHLAQAQSNRAPYGRKTDFGDTLRLIRRWRAGELRLSFVPDAAQRSWRLLCRALGQLAEERTRLHNQIEALLEEGRIKLATVVSDLLGASGWRILQALAEGRKTAAEMAGLADARVRATPQQLVAALEGDLDGACRTLLRQALERLKLMEDQESALRQELSAQQQPHQAVIERLCGVPGIQVLGAQKILAALGERAAAFPTAGHLASWVGVCPGRQESAGISTSQHCPKGHRPLRSLLAQLAWAAVRTKGSYFQELFRRWVPRMGAGKAVWAVAHKLIRIIWRILHEQDTYVERGALALDEATRQNKKRRLVRGLRKLGFEVTLTTNPQPA